ncbi:hypothetical protein [Labilibaculum sp.]|uniref:hypothetical protein n=1 Tax=Labilibaculum sp. TaxID=2060723 RepID=UPI002AA7FB40|nr:hypothetical protein [Labilibaculum sp.]
MKINIEPQLLTPLIPFVLGIIFKTMLDLNLALKLVKYFHWIPVRFLFRTKPFKVSGKWIQLWDNTVSENYVSEETRQSELHLKQFGKYCYAEYRIKNDELYFIFGEIRGNNIIGKWGDKTNELGYYGAFELRILDSKEIKGRWMGHSNKSPEKINTGEWNWKRN